MNILCQFLINFCKIKSLKKSENILYSRKVFQLTRETDNIFLAYNPVENRASLQNKSIFQIILTRMLFRILSRETRQHEIISVEFLTDSLYFC